MNVPNETKDFESKFQTLFFYMHNCNARDKFFLQLLIWHIIIEATLLFQY